MYNASKPLDPKTFVRTVKIIHLALLAGQLLFFVVAFTQTPPHKFDLNFATDPLIIVAPLMAISCFVLSNILFSQQLGIAVNQTSLMGKITRYQIASIIRFALIEGSSLFAIVAFLISGNLLFAMVSGLLILVFIANRPTKDKVETDLNLSYEEKMEMN